MSVNDSFSREDCIREYTNHMNSNKQGYYGSLENYAKAISPLIGGLSPFSKEGWKLIVENDGIYKKAADTASRMFHSNETLQKRFRRILDNSRDVTLRADIGGSSESLEGWGGGNAVYASSQGAFAIGATPFVIGGWLATARSQEIYQIIDNKNSMRLDFEYNIDYLLVNDKKYYYPMAFRSGEVTGFNKLPAVDWVTPNTNTEGHYTAPEAWCGEDMYILGTGAGTAVASAVQGNFLTVSKYNKRGYGIEPNCKFTAIKYAGKDSKTVEKRISLHYEVATGNTNERTFKSKVTLKDVNGFAAPIDIEIYMRISLDTGDFKLMWSAPTAEQNVVKGLKFDGKVSNIANELTNIGEMGTEKTQFVRECEYRNYAKVGLNEYMADNFRIGSNTNISYAAYASDKLLQYTIFNRELEAEEFAITEVLDDGVDVDEFALSKKLGGYVNTNCSFTIGRMLPGLGLQAYKDGLKRYVTNVLAAAETELHLPDTTKREWILLAYDIVAGEFPDIKFENAVVDLSSDPQGNAANERYGFALDSRCGYVDSMGRAVRIIGNTDSRWRDRGGKVFGFMATRDMEYPFLVYYPHAIRMFTAIDAVNSNRTAIYVGGREFRGVFAAGAIALTINGVLDESGIPVNNFEAQMADGRKGYEMKNTVVSLPAGAGAGA